MDFPEFPRKQIFHNKDDVEARRQKLQKYLQETVNKPIVFNSWPMQYFLEIRKHVPYMQFQILHRSSDGNIKAKKSVDSST